VKTYLINLLFIFILLSASCVLIKEQAVGEQPKLAPDFKLQDLNRNTFTLNSYKDKQPVVLFFWTTWCPYCRAELKVLNDMYPQLVKEGWELFAIDVAEPEYRVENFLKNYALSFKILLDRDASVTESFELFGVPTYVLVDKAGYIVFKDNYFPRQEYKKLISG
jgi:peroxiredoxin